ncbi:MAG: ATP-binding protein, partial [Pararhizobium sp.]
MNDFDRLRAEAQAQRDRRDDRNAGNRLLGRVVACSGARAVVSALAQSGDTTHSELWSVGRLVSIKVGSNRVAALVYSMHTDGKAWSETADNLMHIEVELVGEIRNDAEGRARFSAGISQYPFLGAVVHRMRSDDLRAIYDAGEIETAVIGKLTQDETMDAAIHIPSMLQRHFAVVGTTGVGKSTAVALLIRRAIDCDPALRVMILDPHNEFAAAFPDSAVVVDTDTLDLPFWIFKLEEFSQVVFRGRLGVPEEIDALRDLIPEAKRAFRGAADNALFRRSTDKSSLTADTPVPYRIADLLALIDERIGRLEGRSEKPHLRSLKNRIVSVINDPRFHFMFSSNTINDTIIATISHLFRIPGDGRPITTFQLAGIPSEVVDAVASVICRMAFEVCLWSTGGIRILVVCEEAHRYVPADPKLGFTPTRQSIARIAKEGRKYGASLGVVTQRPGELDPTILSQCSTVFAMRLANDLDQEIIRSAIPDSSTSTTSFLSAMGNGEA